MDSSELEHNTIHLTDAAEHAEAVFPFRAEYDQLVVGPYDGRIESVAGENVVVYHESWNRRVGVTGETPSNYFVFGTVSTPDARMNWCGKDLSPQRIGYARPSSPMDFFTGDDESHVAVLIKPRRFFEYFGIDESDFKPQSLYHASCNPVAGRRLIGTVSQLLSERRKGKPLGRPGFEQSDFETMLLESLAPCINLNAEHERHATRRDRAFRDAVEMIRYSVIPIAVTEIAAAVGVSQRTLEYAFREATGITPLQFIRRRRMNCAHRDLRIHDRQTNTVQNVASKWRFTEPGRFAVEYRRIFGRSPSVTLASRKNRFERNLAPAGS